MKKHRYTHTLLFVILIALLSWSSPVRADIAPPKPPVGSNLDPGTETTNVRMMAETVTMDIPSVSQYETGQATVTADFQMRNLSSVEERMDVRFPLCSAEVGGFVAQSLQGYFDPFPAIKNFSVLVNGNSAPVTTTYEDISVWKSEKYSQISVPCWANFPVVFPPNQDVTIKVQYIQAGGYGEFGHRTSNFVTLSYVLFTGAGWKDTIGSADIIARFPVNAEDLSFSTGTEGGTIAGKEVRWHFENFEPDDKDQGSPGRIKLTFLQPKYWYPIQQERANSAAHPQDGETWGRLGKALKIGYGLEHDFYSENFYWESFDAYQKAVDLLPNDADWHYGFAELTCYNAMDYSYGSGYTRTLADDREPYRLCIEQLSQALKINPRHARANELMQFLESREWVDLSGAEPVYRILTPPAPTTITPTETSQPTPTIQPTFTATLTSTNAPTAINTMPAVVSTTSPAPTASPNPTTRGCAAILLPLMMVLIVVIMKVLNSLTTG